MFKIWEIVFFKKNPLSFQLLKSNNLLKKADKVMFFGLKYELWTIY